MISNPFEEPRATSQLRFVKRDSPMRGEQLVLQQRYVVSDEHGTRFEWRDVPYVPPEQENAGL